MKLSRMQIKMICAVYMVAAHILFCFYYKEHILFRAVYTIGEFVPFLFTYFVADGFSLTSNKFRYGCRLLIFGLISQPLYMIAINSNRNRLNIIITFALSVFFLLLFESKTSIFTKSLGAAFFLAAMYHCEGKYVFFLIILCVYLCNKRKLSLEKKFLYSGLIFVGYHFIDEILLYKNLYMFIYSMQCLFGIMIAYLLIKNHYDPNKRNYTKKSRYLFYCIYPMHYFLIMGIHLMQYWGYLPKAVFN